MKAIVTKLLEIDNIDERGLIFNKDDPALSSIFTVQGGSIKKSYDVTRKYLELLRSKDVLTVSINTDRDNLDLVRSCAAFVPEQPLQERPLGDLYAIFEEYQRMNGDSGRKRGLHILEDVFSMQKNLVTGDHELLMEYGGELTSDIVKRLTGGVIPGKSVYYVDKEGGVLTFLPEPDGSALESSLQPLFMKSGYQRYNTSSYDEALQIYSTKMPRMVIIGSLATSTDAKSLLMALERFDPFVKFMEWGAEQADNPDWYGEQFSALYENAYTGAINAYEALKTIKDPLPDELNQKLNLLIKKLGVGYTHQLYVDTAFTLRKLSRQFNVTFFRQLLEGVHNRFRQRNRTM